MTSTVGLVLGDLDLMDDQGSPFAVETLAEGTDWGNPQPIEVAVRSLLQDGSIVVHQGDDNREVALRVIITAPDSAALAEGEAALMAELYRANTLTYTPADGWGPPTVFTVITSSLAHTMDDLGEVRGQRTWSVRLVCEPFGRSETEVTVSALPTAGATTTNLDTMGATTGWTGTVNGVAGTVVNAAGPPTTNAISSASGAGTYVLTLTKTFAATTTSTKLLVVDWKGSVGSTGTLTAMGDGVELGLVAETASPTSGYVRSYFNVAAASLAVTTFAWTSTPLALPAARTLRIDNVAVTNVPPSTSTLRQQSRSLAILGSARTPGTLRVESETAALGDGVLVYTFPAAGANGYTPSMRQYRTAGPGATTDATKVSGAWEPITGVGMTFTVPLNLLPRGAYIVMARLALDAGTETDTIFTTTSTSVAGASGIGQVTASSVVTLTTTYTTVALVRLNLPTMDVGLPANASLALNITSNSGGWTGAPRVDEVWLFNTTIGRLIHVDCGTGAGAVGGAARRLFVAPANLFTTRPTILMGHSADRSDAFYPTSLAGAAVRGWQPPEFCPGLTNVFFVTPNATDAVATFSYFPRWHTHAAE